MLTQNIRVNYKNSLKKHPILFSLNKLLHITMLCIIAESYYSSYNTTIKVGLIIVITKVKKVVGLKLYTTQLHNITALSVCMHNE